MYLDNKEYSFYSTRDGAEPGIFTSNQFICKGGSQTSDQKLQWAAVIKRVSCHGSESWATDPVWKISNRGGWLHCSGEGFHFCALAGKVRIRTNRMFFLQIKINFCFLAGQIHMFIKWIFLPLVQRNKTLMEHQSSCNCHGGVMDHQISKLISALIAATGQFCCVFKIRQLAFLLYLVSENTQR